MNSFKQSPTEMIKKFRLRLETLKVKQNNFKNSDIAKDRVKPSGGLMDLKRISHEVKLIKEQQAENKNISLIEYKAMTKRLESRLNQEDKTDQKIIIDLNGKETLKFEKIAISKYGQIQSKLDILEGKIGTIRSHSTPLFYLDGLDLDNACFMVLDHLQFLVNEGYLALNADFKSTSESLRTFKEKLKNCLKEDYKIEEDLIKLVRKFFFL